ncbi:MAG: hypothetical protein NVS3B20_20170 [Polyangiales bacterium]
MMSPTPMSTISATSFFKVENVRHRAATMPDEFLRAMGSVLAMELADGFRRARPLVKAVETGIPIDSCVMDSFTGVTSLAT